MNVAKERDFSLNTYIFKRSIQNL